MREVIRLARKYGSSFERSIGKSFERRHTGTYPFGLSSVFPKKRSGSLSHLAAYGVAFKLGGSSGLGRNARIFRRDVEVSGHTAMFSGT